jgi:hypothetical protein
MEQRLEIAVVEGKVARFSLQYVAKAVLIVGPPAAARRGPEDCAAARSGGVGASGDAGLIGRASAKIRSASVTSAGLLAS